MRKFRQDNDFRGPKRESRGFGRRNTEERREFVDKPRSFDRKPSFDSRGPPRFEKRNFEVVCSRCGKNCEVPFKPTQNKPVFCSNCFKRNDKEEKKQSSQGLDEINEKLDKILRAMGLE